MGGINALQLCGFSVIRPQKGIPSKESTALPHRAQGQGHAAQAALAGSVLRDLSDYSTVLRSGGGREPVFSIPFASNLGWTNYV